MSALSRNKSFPVDINLETRKPFIYFKSGAYLTQREIYTLSGSLFLLTKINENNWFHCDFVSVLFHTTKPTLCCLK